MTHEQFEALDLLPGLTGSAKQIWWAISIRDLRRTELQATNMDKSLYAERLRVGDATWWIANRDRSLDEFMRVPLPKIPIPSPPNFGTRP